jgi:hypothetical protein
MSIGAITVRNLPPAVARAVRERARRRRISLNKAVVSLLEEATGAGASGSALHHDLDHLAGTWSEAEYRRIVEASKEQRTIDPEMWK